ncbi:MAG TPA: hypothetical protein VK988_16895 [Acidimicrobiales bacterium]|nr:hypothetical protein [Acidimicrobiales bacterium]
MEMNLVVVTRVRHRDVPPSPPSKRLLDKSKLDHRVRRLVVLDPDFDAMLSWIRTGRRERVRE